MKAVVLFSGGLDSTTCLAKAKEEYDDVIALSITYGQKHDKETECADKIAEYYGVELIRFDASTIFKDSSCTLLKGNEEIPTGTYEEQLKENDVVSTYVPFRNGLFLSIATSIAISRNCDVVIYGVHKDDAAGNAYPDCSEAFNHAMGCAIYEGSGYAVSVKAPFINKTKAEIVAEGLKLKVPYELTWSCYKGGDKPCGECATCIDRQKAFEMNGVKDPIYL